MAGLFARFRGGGGSGIEADLRRITDADVLDVPKDVLMNIVQASHSADDRREIMNHLRIRLAETEGKNWRRIYGGLVLVEQLLQRGSRALMVETAEGHHFDLVQRLTFLSNFEFSEDKRVQTMVRQKATFLRSEVLTRMENPGDTQPQSLSGADREAAEALEQESGQASHVLSSASSTSVPRSPPPQKGPVVLNGIVSVGHRDDTSEESGAEDSTAKTIVAKRRAKSNGYSKDLQARNRRVLDESTDSDSSSGARQRKQEQKTTPTKAPPVQAAPPPVAPAAETVDLLGM